MMNWLRSVLGLNRTNGKAADPMPIPPAPAAPMDPARQTQHLTQVEVANIQLEAEALEAEAALQDAMKQHTETISDHDPEMQKLAQRLRQMDQEPAGDPLAQT